MVKLGTVYDVGREIRKIETGEKLMSMVETGTA